MRTPNSLLAPSAFILAAGIAFSFYSTPYHSCFYLPPPFHIGDIIIHPGVICPEREFGVTLIVAGSILIALILTTQTALSHFNRHSNQALQRNLPLTTFTLCWHDLISAFCQYSEAGKGSRAGWQKEKGKMIRRIGETLSVPAPEPLLAHMYKLRFNGIRLLSFECIDST